MNMALGHRLRCITVKAGIVNTCPDCGVVTITDFCWDFDRDPAPDAGPIVLSNDTKADVVAELRELATSTSVSCVECG